jgi:hypothetical protein
MSIKKEPSYYYKDPLNQNKKPPASLDLEFVFGYNGEIIKTILSSINSETLCITLQPLQ